MLRRLALQDIAIVQRLELELASGFTVLTGETGAGKSILIDALQFVLGERADASRVREGAARAEVVAEFDTPHALRPWLHEAGFDGPGGADGEALLLRRVVDAQGRSRAWINGGAATMAQLREAAESLVEIHGQHAWQRLTQAGSARALLDGQAGVDSTALREAWASWRARQQALDQARAQQEAIAQERERLAWQIAELERLAPLEGEWAALNAEHQRLAHGQSLLDAVREALQALSEAEPAADALTHRAIESLQSVLRHDPQLGAVVDVLQGAQAQLQDAAHTLHAYVSHTEPDPERLAELEGRIGGWMSLARRYRRAPDELPALLHGWQTSLRELDIASDLASLEGACQEAEAAWRVVARRVSQKRQRAAPLLAASVTQAMQQLGMAGGVFEVALVPLAAPDAQGLEAVELRFAGHAGATPRPLAKVASGGELSRLALAVAVTTSRTTQAAAGAGPALTSETRGSLAHEGPATLIFDEIDAGVGGAVADQVGRLMKELGAAAQVLAVTHLAQVAACADQHFVVSKSEQAGVVSSHAEAVAGVARVAEVARMLGGERLAGTSRAHAAAMLESHHKVAKDAAAAPTPGSKQGQR